MRTTLTLDPDVAAALRALTRERGISFKRAVNDALRAGLRSRVNAAEPFRTQTHPMRTRAGVDLTKALAIAAQLEDEEIIRKLELGK